ncbi:ABC transporter ATP-binding protein [Methanoculleus sp. YWC-01]|jgi:iron complex transport system ATP-binding protein|uniref:ABC transporter ATP-binding protein n=1 Tax=Methanoculleus nereidis TaxID=2735141 RepID=A0ABU3Z0N5_9EURY|nr:ABC transporter ATP-binding protein [Methanoculleus sp. YWC-01]MCK9297759.1 ABC transporter ATP-binding protein [Methanoculleus sp.]MDV4342365.1 ABC transporter ATP-binding protein [Methanoculleus sp. YWC-01]PKL55480.1 MAG: ABC transporter ATP-binding protein [Methanomicrobiales archaeon HGW-Methanomicrobiales-6]
MKPIEIIDIDVSYGAKKILEAITFHADTGEILGIIGPNGSGKTTLLKAMSRVVARDSGEIRLDNRDLDTLGYRELARQVAVVPQDISIGFDYAVRDVVMMGRHPYIGRLASETLRDVEICDRAMHLANVAHLAGMSIHSISGGERQRVLIARALAQEPKILLLDEATSNLDVSHQVDILNIIKELAGKITVVSVFHDLNLAAYYCDRLLLLKDRRVYATGTPEEVLTYENIREIFQMEALVRPHPLTGKPYILPVYAHQSRVGTNRRVHVVCGGGTGSDILHLLYAASFTVTCGVLNVLDTDYGTAMRLGLSCIAEPPFHGITPGSLSDLRKCLDSADAIIVTAMPIGRGNLDNLQVLLDYPKKPILLYSGNSNSRMEDYTGGEADAVLTELESRGALRIEGGEELLAGLPQGYSDQR